MHMIGKHLHGGRCTELNSDRASIRDQAFVKEVWGAIVENRRITHEEIQNRSKIVQFTRLHLTNKRGRPALARRALGVGYDKLVARIENPGRSSTAQIKDQPVNANEGSMHEIAIVIVDNECSRRDIVIQRKASNKLQHISKTHRSYDALQYPVLFWHDMCAKIETERLEFIRHNQQKLRSGEYIHLRDVMIDDVNVDNMGKLVILPSTFTGSLRHMHEYAHDAITHKRGLPHSHNLIWFQNKIQPNQIDDIIKAEFPNPEEDPDLYSIIVKTWFMARMGPTENFAAIKSAFALYYAKYISNPDKHFPPRKTCRSPAAPRRRPRAADTERLLK
ncbi:hypothetical protein EVAR_40785_1 [Eumeta japonica]|uniref:Helitron helicase-like domain-containing protein n=1 Tax=Eumeta variegata TaxID=151549 RepID=A0A4C1X2H8_EUMVA|nr:hypothetical protein EVAR_40785_1 [Eumeta japonica]